MIQGGGKGTPKPGDAWVYMVNLLSQEFQLDDVRLSSRVLKGGILGWRFPDFSSVVRAGPAFPTVTFVEPS